MKQNMKDPGFYLCTSPINGGFVMKFANNYVVSVRWGSGNYSDPMPVGPEWFGDLNAQTAEVGVWRELDNGPIEWYHVDGFDYDGDDVLPRLESEHVAEIMWKVANLPVWKGDNDGGENGKHIRL